MKRFKLKKIATKIVQLEKIIMNATDPAVREQAEQEIMQLTIKNNLSLVDMMEIDEIVQDMLQ
jgi:hypothetical protein